ncbi:hypothetical protein HNQ02_001964 [Flavobacterium sp. 7E]|uniref:hypothetical protein n=1 Tax=Flavobacterium sp. 7E TaxID=2735898 RepID=UPI00156E5740|nr:hypothetical protein [Flavobacterium sp. 7E]NRS89044.1 hypothetical protein [Flavobacterium sp. 7E]
MDIQLEKQEIIERLLQTNDESIIASIKSLLTKDKKDFWEELTPEQQNDIKLSLQEFAEGKVSDFEEFITPYLSK